MLVCDLDSKAVALALEAWHAAKAIWSDPEHVRGGPWLSVRALKGADLFEVKAAAGCSSAVLLGPLAEQLGPESRLYKHLKDLKFGPKSGKPSASSGASSSSASSSKAVSAKAKSQAKAKSKAKPLKAAPDWAKAVRKPPKTKELSLFIRAKRSGTATGESGNQYRVRKGLEGEEFVKHKLGNKPVEAKKAHWAAYAPMRRMCKRPSARVCKRPSARV